MENFLCKQMDIKESERKSFKINGAEILLMNHEGNLYAFGRYCTHAHFPLDDAIVVNNNTLRCQTHRFDFCLETGRYKRAAPKCKNLPMYPIHIENGDIFIQMPAK